MQRAGTEGGRLQVEQIPPGRGTGGTGGKTGQGDESGTSDTDGGGTRHGWAGRDTSWRRRPCLHEGHPCGDPRYQEWDVIRENDGERRAEDLTVGARQSLMSRWAQAQGDRAGVLLCK